MGLLKTKKPDGYTIGMASSGSLISQHMRKVPYDLLKDFTFVMQYADYTFGLAVLPNSPLKTFKEFIDYAQANPGKIRYSSAGPGSSQSLVMAALANHFQIKWTHIPFEGGPPALAAILGGHVEAYTTTMHCKPQIQAGQLRLLAAYGEKRLPSFPNVPTLKEMGIPVVAASFMAIIGQKGLPAEVVEVLHQAFKKAMDDQEFIKGCTIVDHVAIYRNPQETTRHIQRLSAEIGTLVQDLKLRKE